MNEIRNQLKDQCFDIPELSLVQFDRIAESIQSLPVDSLKNVKKIIVSGCGDSYIAAEAAETAFNKYLRGTDCRMFSMRAHKAARFASFSGEDTLVIAVSASGGPARVTEILEKANAHGCLSMSLTNNPESRAAKAAKYVLCVNTPEHEAKRPGLRSYFASLLALDMLAVWFGQIKGAIAEEESTAVRNALMELADSYRAALPEIDKKAYEAAEKLSDKKAFEIIGDGPLYASAQFVAAKYAEVSGDKALYVDSEDYCHVSTFFYPRKDVGTIYLADVNAPAKSRVSETANEAYVEGRDIIFVSNSGKAAFGLNDEIFEITVPSAKAGYEFLDTLFDYIAGSIVSSYRPDQIGEVYFRTDRPIYKDVETIRTSEVKIY